MEGRSKTEMAEEIWKGLSEDLLIQILARLPMKSIMRFHAVSKSWRKMFQSLEFKQLVSTIAVSSIPAFLIVQERDAYPQPLLEYLWISTESSYKFHRLSLDFLPSPVHVVASCKSLLCCCGKDEIYICNPVTRTWLELPERGEQTRWDFICLAFDTCGTCCTLIIGKFSTAVGMVIAGTQNDIVVEMYDSKANKWIQLETTSFGSVWPTGEGIYSNGKFYWVNGVYKAGQIFNVVSFDVEQRKWNAIYGPPDLGNYLVLRRLFTTHATAGCESHIVLVCARDLSFWKLIADEVEGEKWSAVNTLVKEHDLRSPGLGVDIAIHESGCVLALVLPTNSVAIWNEEGKMLNKTVFSELPGLAERFFSRISVHVFEVNNVWWP